MWCAPLTTVIASAPARHSAGLSLQLKPTTLRLRKMTLTEPLMSTWPCSSAPQMPAMVLFEPTFTLPAASTPFT